MAEITEKDRERAYLLLGSSDNRHDHAELVATALAEERERARAPFLALADAWEGKGESGWQQFRRALANDHASHIYAKRLRAAALESEP